MGNISEDTLDPAKIACTLSARRRDPWRGTSWAIAMLVVALALVVMLAGCGSDESAPPPARTTTATPTPTASPTPAVPVMPEAAKQHTKEGAEAFVRYFWEVMNYVQSTGEVDAVRVLTYDGCAGCEGGLKAVRQIYDDGGRIEGGQNAVTSLKTTFGWVNGTKPVADMHLKVKVAESRVAYSDPSRDQTLRGGTVSYHLSVSAMGEDGLWQVGQLDGEK